MGRAPCCSKDQGLTRGAWTALEDKILVDYISTHGEGKWRNISKFSGLKRRGKSCRLRWLNYLQPDIKRGNISPEEEDLIIRLHKLLGNRWCLIAGRIPGRTDNEIKNYWNTTLRKKVKIQESNASIHMKLKTLNKIEPNAVQTKGAIWFTKTESTLPTSSNPRPDNRIMAKEMQSGAESELSMDFNLSDLLTSDFPDSELWKLLDGGIETLEFRDPSRWRHEPFLFSDKALRDFPVAGDNYFDFRA